MRGLPIFTPWAQSSSIRVRVRLRVRLTSLDLLPGPVFRRWRCRQGPFGLLLLCSQLGAFSRLGFQRSPNRESHLGYLEFDTRTLFEFA